MLLLDPLCIQILVMFQTRVLFIGTQVASLVDLLQVSLLSSQDIEQKQGEKAGGERDL